MVSDGKVVSNIHGYVYLLMYMHPRSSSSSSHTQSLSLYRFFRRRRRLSFFVSLTVTINLSVFLSDVLRWTHRHVCIYIHVHLTTPSMKLMTELIQCKYDLPFRLTVSSSERRWGQRRRKIPRKKMNELSQSGQLYSHYPTQIDRTSLDAHITRTFFLSLSLVFFVSCA